LVVKKEIPFGNIKATKVEQPPEVITKWIRHLPEIIYKKYSRSLDDA
jgi:hypothetical protein